MKWRGQGLLVGSVIVAAVAFGYQWTSVVKMEDEALAGGLDYRPYMNRVSEFVNQQRRWPEPDEIYLPIPPEDGVIKNVELQSEGKILVTFSAWTIRSGRVEAVLAPTLSSYGSQARGRLRYSCLSVDPVGFERLVCRTIGYTTTEQLAQDNANGFEEWLKNEADAKQRNEDFQRALEAAQDVTTRCDELWMRAQGSVVPCLRAVDPDTADSFSKRSDEIFNGPRLRPDVIARNPDMLEQFNQECDSNWTHLTVVTRDIREEFSACF